MPEKPGRTGRHGRTRIVDRLATHAMREGWRYARAAEVGLPPIPRGLLLDLSSPTKVPELLALGVSIVCNDNDNPDHQPLKRYKWIIFLSIISFITIVL